MVVSSIVCDQCKRAINDPSWFTVLVAVESNRLTGAYSVMPPGTSRVVPYTNWIELDICNDDCLFQVEATILARPEVVEREGHLCLA